MHVANELITFNDTCTNVNSLLLPSPLIDPICDITVAGRCCGYSTLKCYTGYFTDELCPRPSTINVTSATYGLSDCQSYIGECCPKDTDCEIRVTVEYLGTIKTNCNGRQGCNPSLRAAWSPATECGASGQTDYVTIYYDCLQGKLILFNVNEKYRVIKKVTWMLPYRDLTKDKY